jgi:pyroglutamyl-peptidase
MLKVLLTGFEPFNKARLNPSGELVNRVESDSVEGAQISTAVLPVTYRDSAAKLISLIEEQDPDVIICFGQAEGRISITPERFAVNLNDASIADNGGEKRVNQKIHPDYAAAFESTLPVPELVAALREKGIPAATSLSAGAFVCNHIFYEMQRALEGRGKVSGFVHVPLMNEQQEDFPGLFTMDIELMVLAAKTLVETLVTRNN